MLRHEAGRLHGYNVALEMSAMFMRGLTHTYTTTWCYGQSVKQVWLCMLEDFAHTC